jgi:hypothetical protein
MRRGSLLAAAMLAASATAAQTAPRSLAMSIRTTIDSGAAKHVTGFRVQVWGTKSRMDFSSDLLPEGTRSYMVFDSKDSMTLSVVPSAKMATIMRMPSTNYVPDIPTFSSSKVTRDDVVDLGPGERILGFATHRYRYVRARTTTATYADRICTETHTSTQEVWLSTDPEPGAIMKAIDSGGMHPQSMAQARTRAVGADSLRRKLPEGVQLRSIALDTAINPDGSRTATAMTSEYTELSRAPLDSTLFVMPDGFKLMDMRGITVSGDFSKVFPKETKPLRPGCVAKK